MRKLFLLLVLSAIAIFFPRPIFAVSNTYTCINTRALGCGIPPLGADCDTAAGFVTGACKDAAGNCMPGPHGCVRSTPAYQPLYCDGSGNDTTTPTDKFSTAIGCIPIGGLGPFLEWTLGWIFGAVGGVIVLMIIFTGYTFMTSQGNPEKLKEVSQQAVGIISGILMIAFSLVLLKAVGANILGLPGF